MGQLLSDQSNQQSGGDAGFRGTAVPSSVAEQMRQEVLDEDASFAEEQVTPPAFEKSLDSHRFVRSSPTDEFPLNRAGIHAIQGSEH